MENQTRHHIRHFSGKVTVEAPGKTSSDLKFDKFLEDGKLIGMFVEVFEHKEVVVGAQTLLQKKAVLQSRAERDPLMLKMRTGGDSVTISGNSSETKKSFNVFALDKMFGADLFRGWDFPKETELIFNLEHVLDDGGTPQLHFPLAAYITCWVDYAKNPGA